MPVSGVGQPGHGGGYHAARTMWHVLVIARSVSDEAIQLSFCGAMDCVASLAMTKLDLRVRQNNPTGKSLPDFRNPMSSPMRKNIPLSPSGKSMV
jgi:hypothetical protein